MMESRTDETHFWTEKQSGSETQEDDTFHRKAWTDNLDQGNEGVGTTIAGSAMMAISVFANLCVIATITSKIRGEERVSSVYFLVRHLAAASLLLSCLFMPLEMQWTTMDTFPRWTSWLAQEAVCRLMAVLSNFGLYLTAFLIVCITLDRYLAVMRPLEACRSVRRARKMSKVTLVASSVCSVVEVVPYLSYKQKGKSIGRISAAGVREWVYHVESDPVATWKTQCTSTGLLGSWALDLTYVSVKGIIIFGFPFATILTCYSCMFWKLWRLYSDCVRYNVGLNLLRSANMTTLKLSFAIAFLFIICWGPKNVIAFWSVADFGFHFKVKPMVQVYIRSTAYASSCLFPIEYLY